MPTDDFPYQMDEAITELVDRLPPAEAAALENTRWHYADRPSPADLRGFPPGSVMLGLYNAPRHYSRVELLNPKLPPPTITVFVENARLMRFSARDVVTHEAGHRLGYGHDSAAVIPCGTEFTAMPDIVRAVTSRAPSDPISCFC